MKELHLPKRSKLNGLKNNFENVFEKVIQNLVNTNKGMERTGKKQTTINTNYGYFSRSVFYKERNIYIYFGWNYDEQIPLYIGYNLENDHKFRIFKIMEKVNILKC